MARNILAYLEYDAPAHVTLPHNLITGATGTAGVGGSDVGGAHGPRHLCIAPVRAE